MNFRQAISKTYHPDSEGMPKSMPERWRLITHGTSPVLWGRRSGVAHLPALARGTKDFSALTERIPAAKMWRSCRVSLELLGVA